MEKRFRTVAVTVFALLLLVVGRDAGAIVWEGLTWTTQGAGTITAVDGNGWLNITVIGGQSGDPSPDNWNVTTSLTSLGLTQANAPWVKFTIVDTATGSSTVGGPRAYIDTDQSPQETMLQGGIYEGYSNYWMNHNAYSYTTGWTNDPNDWMSAGARAGGDHTVMFGMRTNGMVDMYFDDVLRMSIDPDPNFTFFKRAYLGLSAASGTFSGTYKSFDYGTGYAPVPIPGALLLFGSGLLGLVGIGRKRLQK